MSIIYLNQLGVISPLGNGLGATKRALLELGQSGVALSDAFSPGRRLPVGRIDTNLSLPPMDRLPLPDRSRNNQLALVALAQIRPAVDDARERFGAARVGVVIGTSTSGVGEAETALRDYVSTGALPEGFHYGQQELVSPAAVLAAELDVTGPAYVHSSACASSAKALASAARLIRMNACDAVVAGGVDTLCRFTVAGFAALESLSTKRCNPLSRNRDGINIGEGAALFLVSREPATVSLRGWGESSDGYHMSAPDPAGVGGRLALEQALARAAVTAADIEYVNLHGTATVQNDAMEAELVHRVFGGHHVFVSSTKPFTGHALGAAGITEAIVVIQALEQQTLPPAANLRQPEPALALDVITQPRNARLRYAMSNNFGFGGSNCSLIFGRAD